MPKLELEHTPFMVVSFIIDPTRYVLSRKDTLETLCIGVFMKKLADAYNEGDTVYLHITKDGYATEHFPEQPDITKEVTINAEDGSCIVAVVCGGEWITPDGFNEWVINTFKHE